MEKSLISACNPDECVFTAVYYVCMFNYMMSKWNRVFYELLHNANIAQRAATMIAYLFLQRVMFCRHGIHNANNENGSTLYLINSYLHYLYLVESRQTIAYNQMC